MKIRAKKISKGSLYKLILVSQLIPMGFFCIGCGIAAAFGASTITLNGSPQTGFSGLLASLVIFPVFLVMMSGVLWIGAALGLWMYSWFRDIEIEFKDAQLVNGSDFNRGNSNERISDVHKNS